MQQLVTIGAVCQGLGVSPSLVRWWEAQGHVTPVREGVGGRRLYTEADVARLKEWRASRQEEAKGQQGEALASSH